MTSAQIRKLETILGKLEALQNEVRSPRIADKLGKGKSELLVALSEGSRK